MADPNFGFTLAQQGINLAPGASLPSSNITSGTGLSSGNGTSTSKPGAPGPRKVQNFEIKQKLLRPALTSHFQCWFNPPRVPEVEKYYLDRGETISLLCSDSSLPGSSIITNEINDDYTGVTERLGYRRSYDQTTDFTFYIDHGTLNGGYNVIRFFESWIRYSMGETSEAPDAEYHYRVRYPDEPNTGYRTNMFIQKFERDFFGNYLEYIFVKAYPISISSMPVSYNASELLRCTVSFTYNRYILKSVGNTSQSEPRQNVAPGVPISSIEDSQFELDSSGLYDKTAQALIDRPLYNKSAGSGALI